MKIGSNIKPRQATSRLVTMHGTPYNFTKQDNGEFVADVTRQGDVDTFLASRHFYAVGKPKLQAPKQQENTTPPPAETLTTEEQAINDEAATLIEGSGTDIGRDVGNVSGLAVVKRAIVLEGEGQNRKTVIQLLEKTLDQAKQAGVTE